MRIGPFINLISETFGVPEKTTTVVARALREAGWLTSGARGVNAPDMTATDAARLSLALLTGEPPSTVVKELEFFRNLQCGVALSSITFPGLNDLDEKHSLEQALTEIINAVSSDGWEEQNTEDFYGTEIRTRFALSIDFSYRRAMLYLGESKLKYNDIEGEETYYELIKIKNPDLTTIRTILDVYERSKIREHGMQIVRTISMTELHPISVALKTTA